jgi:hypothetical protein
MSDGPSLVEHLLSPEAYPHPVVTPVRLVETHISWVLLTGDYAYKIKKPVRLSFLDYSTLARRRLCCEEEIRLNRRYAPGLYLGVSRVCGPPVSPRMDGDGAALEYAVRMRQFDTREELDVLVEARSVETSELAALGEHIARFHAAAEPADPGSAYGRPETVYRVIIDNFSELRRLPEASQWSELLLALERWIGEVHDRAGLLIQARRDSGRVRECHGDLHCRNVVRWEGELTPFDGIEFDPALRFVDVANDLAFLTMDLDERGRTDLRHAVLQAWVESLGDFGGLPLLPYFEAYRALVRAKVAALRALQERAASPERAKECAGAGRYLEWAVARTRRPRPALVLTCGLSGSGKTWMARALAPRLRALHVRSDVERKRLAGLGPLEDSRSPLDGGIYTPEFTERTYARLRQCAEDALRGGESVIVDAAFLKRDERRRMRELASAMSTPMTILHCVSPPEVLRARVAHRAESGRDASEAGVAILERQPGFWEEFADEERAHAVTVDTSAPGAVAACLGRLRELQPA